MNNFDNQYKELCNFILNDGEVKKDRTGVGTISYFVPKHIRINLQDGFPLLTTRKIHFKSVVHELLWFLSAYDDKYKKFGNTNIRYLLDNNVTFWTEWVYKEYEKNCEYYNISKLTQKEFEEEIKSDDSFALKWGDLGPIYGHQWTNFGNQINQIDDVISLLKNDPDSRRLLVSAWNPVDMRTAALPCCHMLFQFYTNKISVKDRIQLLIDKVGSNYTKDYEDSEVYENYLERVFIENKIPERKLSLMLHIRSNDIALGNPYNVAEYSLLLLMIGQIVNMIPYEFILNIGDSHLYMNSIEAIKTILSRQEYDLPTITLNKDIKSIYDFREKDIILNNYQSHPNIKIDVAI